jgi:3-deoxy-manno-octulosonate cytidylyltransferase (CMP-KDO synthetase)
VHPDKVRSNSGATQIVGAIPARYGSTRLAAKALVPLAGRPMIEHVYRRAAQAIRQADGLDRLVVLTDDERIASVVRGFGGEVEMTPVECSSGTDRIAWAARAWSAAGVVNIQGDEPLIDPAGIARVARHLRSEADDPIVTLAADGQPGDAGDPSVVKVVLDRAGYALYFSRAAIPHPRNAGAVQPLRHLGIYGYQRAALLELAALEPTPLERTESLEQLRALENGIRIRVLTGAVPSRGVDTAEDALEAARELERLSATEVPT